MDLETLDSFERTFTLAMAEENIFSRLGMLSALLSDVPAIVALARKQLLATSVPASPPTPP